MVTLVKLLNTVNIIFSLQILKGNISPKLKNIFKLDVVKM